ncbi:MAG: chemotaxis-specific protein-glutamate methyltransferase CheB [Polyangiales bacterium]
MSARVLMIDDSPAMRRLLASRVRTAKNIEVVGMAGDPYEARDKIAELQPNVLTLDIEMPRMNGLDFLRRLMRHHPIPTVVVSTLAGPRTAVAIEALQLGAVLALGKDEAKKPGVLADAIRSAHGANVSILGVSRGRPPIRSGSPKVASSSKKCDVIAIGVSTGGPHALAKVFADLPPGLPPIVVVQHMPAEFTAPLASRLNGLSAVNVSEAVHGRVLGRGEAVIAPGGRHLRIRKNGARVITELSDDAEVEYHRPSVDVLFRSVARTKLNCLAIVMTGMGRDGASGLLALRNAGALTLAQDQATSLVYGMPQEAVKNGAAMSEVPLSRIAETLARIAAGSTERKSA